MTELPSRTNVYIYEGMGYADTGKIPKYNNEPSLMCSTGYIGKLPAEILELTEHSYKEPKINEKTQE